MREQLADGIVSLDVDDGVGTCALAQRVLVNHLYMAYLFQVALQLAVFAWGAGSKPEVGFQGRTQYALYEARFARTAHARNDGHHVERYLYVYVLQVVKSATKKFY